MCLSFESVPTGLESAPSTEFNLGVYDGPSSDGRGRPSKMPNYRRAFNQFHQRKTTTPMNWNGKLR